MPNTIYIEPRQPLFVTASETYRKYVINKYGIVHFYSCHTGDKPRFAVPDGSVDIVFCCDDITPTAFVCGSVMQLENVLIKPYTHYFGVRFRPGFNPIPEAGSIMGELIGKEIPFDDITKDEKLLYGIWQTRDFYEQIKIFMHSYMSMYKRVCEKGNPNLISDYSLNRIMMSGGLVTLGELAEKTGYSERYINKIFKMEIGLSPKQFAKIIRFQKTVAALNYSQNISLTEIATDMGYFDQAHFVHDFKAYTGLTPKSYRGLLNDTEFYKKLEIIRTI